MPQEITQDDNGKFFYMPLGKLYGFANETAAIEFKAQADEMIAHYEANHPFIINGETSDILEKTNELTMLVDGFYQKQASTH